MTLTPRLRWLTVAILGIGALVLSGVVGSVAQGAGPSTTFGMTRTVGLPANCAANAKANVKIVSNGATETMTVTLSGMPHSTDFDFFVIQQPAAPFGMSWYQGDIETTATGTGTGKFIGRFSVETFVVAPGSVPAPKPHGALDASPNPATGPIHMFHLGLWFNSPADAVANNCPNVTTPFNGTHNAGPQLLNTHTVTNPLARIH
jgi:hypothetical protein